MREREREGMGRSRESKGMERREEWGEQGNGEKEGAIREVE